VELQKQAGLEITESHLEGGDLTVELEKIPMRLRQSGKHTLRIRFVASPHRCGRNLRPMFDEAVYH
jgi:hypothetical protein